MGCGEFRMVWYSHIWNDSLSPSRVNRRFNTLIEPNDLGTYTIRSIVHAYDDKRRKSGQGLIHIASRTVPLLRLRHGV